MGRDNATAVALVRISVRFIKVWVRFIKRVLVIRIIIRKRCGLGLFRLELFVLDFIL